MTLTKPAGAFLQILGAVFIVFGVAAIGNGSILGAVACWAIAWWMLRTGRKPLLKGIEK